MELTLYESESWFGALADEWGELLGDSTTNQIFLTPTWLETWWHSYQPGSIWALALRDDSGRLVGIAPWYRTTHDDGTRAVGAIGGVEVTDYIEVIARRGSEEAVYSALADWLGEQKNHFDVMRLANIPGESPMMTRWPAMLQARGFAVNSGFEDVCPVIYLPDTFLDYIASLDKKQRHELRRKLRNATGNVTWYIVGSDHDLKNEMATFLNLMANSSPEKAVFLQDKQNRDFFESIVPAVAAQGWLQLAILTLADTPTAAYLNFDYNNQILVYNSGYDPEAQSHLSPGIVLLGRLIEHAITCKRAVFDFLQGSEPYKYHMGGQDTTVCWLEILPER